MSEKSSEKKVYSILEAVKVTGIGKTSLYASIAKGHLVAKKYGTRTLITSEALDAFISNLPTKSSKEPNND